MTIQFPFMQTSPICLPDLNRKPRTVGTDLTEKTSYEAAIKYLEENGWTPLGKGCFCTAYLSPDGERVVKLGRGSGQRATIETALENPDNPHLPKIYGFVEYMEDNFIVETEALEHFPEYDLDDPCFDLNNQQYQEWSDEWNPKYVDFEEAPDCTMKEAIAALSNALGYYGGQWDCHDGNIMIRPSTGELVLNDLIA